MEDHELQRLAMRPVITSFPVRFTRERAGGPSDRQVGILQDRQRNQGFGLWTSIWRRISIKRLERIQNDFFSRRDPGCVFCQNFQISKRGAGIKVDIILKRRFDCRPTWIILAGGWWFQGFFSQ